MLVDEKCMNLFNGYPVDIYNSTQIMHQNVVCVMDMRLSLRRMSLPPFLQYNSLM